MIHVANSGYAQELKVKVPGTSEGRRIGGTKNKGVSSKSV